MSLLFGSYPSMLSVLSSVLMPKFLFWSTMEIFFSFYDLDSFLLFLNDE